MEKKLRRIMEACDPATGKHLGSSIKGAIRYGLDGDRRIGHQMSLEIGVNARPSGDGVSITSAEVHLTVHLLYSADVTVAA